MTRVLEANPLTRDGFAAFGDVIETDGATHFPINQGTIERYHDLARVDVDEAGRPLISIFECSRAVDLPHRVERVERHALGSQAFIPMSKARMLIVVAMPIFATCPDIWAMRIGPPSSSKLRC